jgi:SAM-dependent methyltransferase
MHGDFYDEDYFVRGKEKGVSLYENYRWMPELTIPMVRAIAAHCGINKDILKTGKHETVLDFGCARGYVVRAFRELGYAAWGVDASLWAIENCDPAAKEFVSLSGSLSFTGKRGFDSPCKTAVDWIIAKDVLEHVQDIELEIDVLMSGPRKGIFAVVPLSAHDGHPYVVPEYERDITHIHRLTLKTWAGMFMRPGWAVTAQYRVPGVKDNYAYAERGNGFITARRLCP